MDNENLKTINWGEGITTIGTAALANTGLEELTIPNFVTQIGFLAVRKNDQLAQVSFEEGRTSPLSMGAWAFSETPTNSNGYTRRYLSNKHLC